MTKVGRSRELGTHAQLLRVNAALGAKKTERKQKTNHTTRNEKADKVFVKTDGEQMPSPAAL